MDLISFGAVFLELVFGHLPELPGPGEEVVTGEFSMSCGGAVTSATLAAAGGLRSGLCTVLGSDFGSQVVRAHCASAGVDVSPSAVVGRPAAGITVVLNFGGDRGFITYLPERGAGERPVLEHWRDVLRRERPAWCYVHAGAGMPPFLREARELGCKIVLDTALSDLRPAARASGPPGGIGGGLEAVGAIGAAVAALSGSADGPGGGGGASAGQSANELVIECVRLADYFVPNAGELLRLTGTADLEAAVAVAAGWGTQLVVTRGAAGALLAGPDGAVTEVTEGVRQVTVRDLTGAGDSFAGALIAALHRGASLPEAVAAANAAGSRAVGLLGAVGEVGGFSGAGGEAIWGGGGMAKTGASG